MNMGSGGGMGMMGLGGMYGATTASFGMTQNGMHARMQNMSAYMAPMQYGILATGFGSARDNMLPAVISKVNRDEHKAVLRARRYGMEVSLKFAQRKQAEKKQKMQAQQVQRQRAVSIMCKIYVGSIYYEIGEQTIRHSFETFGPVRSIDMSYDQSGGMGGPGGPGGAGGGGGGGLLTSSKSNPHICPGGPGAARHKGFCFLEFEAPEAAFMALDNMQNITIGGRAVKVGRLSNIGQAQHFIQQFAAEAAKYNRVYIANIHQNIQDEDIRQVFESFGEVISCQLVRNPETGEHKRYGFVEYKLPKSMKEAIASMNNFDLGGQLIRVGSCVVPPSMHQLNTVVNVNNPSGALTGAKRVAEMLKNMKKEKEDEKAKKEVQDGTKPAPPTSLAEQEGIGIGRVGQTRNLMMQKLMRSQQTRVICLRNMVGPDEIDAALEGEVTEECSNYGQVEKVVIYQEKQSADANAETIVKIFVQYTEPAGVGKAREALGGRFFSGRKINATPYDQSMFELKDYTA